MKEKNIEEYYNEVFQAIKASYPTMPDGEWFGEQFGQRVVCGFLGDRNARLTADEISDIMETI